MPVYLRPNELFVKNPNGAGYLPQNVISQTSTAEMLEAFDQTIANTQESLNTMTSAAQQAVDGIEAQKNTMIASIASVAGQGTDTTLTQSGVAADAKVVGDEVSDLKSALDKSIAPGVYEPTAIEFPASSIVLNEALKTNGGVTKNTNGRAHTLYINKSRVGKAFSINLPGYLFRVFFHTGTTEASFVRYDEKYYPCDGNIYVLPDASYTYRICFYHDPVDSVAFTSEEGANIANALILYDYAKNSLDKKIDDLSDAEDEKIDSVNEKIDAHFSVLCKSIAPGVYEPTGEDYPEESVIINRMITTNGAEGAQDGCACTNYINGSRIGKAFSINLPGYLFRVFFFTGKTVGSFVGYDEKYYPCDGTIYLIPDVNNTFRLTLYHDPVDTVPFTDAEKTSIADAVCLYDYAKNAIEPGESDEIRMIRREATAMGLCTIPDSIGMLNVIRRARQHTDVKWTPVANMRRTMLQGPNYTHPDEPVITEKSQRRRDDLFLSGNEYTGIPYTEVGNSRYEYNSTIGNLDSFVSATQYTNTMAYSDDNYKTNTPHSAQMGGTCVDIPLYAYEMPRGHLNTWSSRFSTEVKNVFGESYSDFRPDLLRQGDILNSDSHVVMITDIAKDESGNVVSIEISENTTTGNMIGEIGTQYGGKTRRWSWPLRDFYNYFGRNDYKAYRVKQALIDRVTYTPLLCVQVGTETQMCYNGPLPLIPENGNKCILARGPKPYSNSLNDNVTLMLEKTRAVANDDTTIWNKIAVTDPDGNTQKYGINGNTITLTPSINGIWSACPQVVNENDQVMFTGASTEWYVILLSSITYTFDGSGGFTLQVSHQDTDDCELIGFVMNATGGVVLEAIPSFTCTSEVVNGVRTWTVTGNGLSVNNNEIRHIAFRTPFGLAKCVSDRVY